MQAAQYASSVVRDAKANASPWADLQGSGWMQLLQAGLRSAHPLWQAHKLAHQVHLLLLQQK
jgi:hypothetical protein